MTRSLKRKSQVYLYLLENVHKKNSLDPNLPCKQVLAANICIMLSLCKGTFHWQSSMSYNTSSLGGKKKELTEKSTSVSLDLLYFQLLCNLKFFCDSFSSCPGHKCDSSFGLGTACKENKNVGDEKSIFCLSL